MPIKVFDGPPIQSCGSDLGVAESVDGNHRSRTDLARAIAEVCGAFECRVFTMKIVRVRAFAVEPAVAADGAGAPPLNGISFDGPWALVTPFNKIPRRVPKVSTGNIT
jgi:hypothetical protein